MKTSTVILALAFSACTPEEAMFDQSFTDSESATSSQPAELDGDMDKAIAPANPLTDEAIDLMNDYVFPTAFGYELDEEGLIEHLFDLGMDAEALALAQEGPDTDLSLSIEELRDGMPSADNPIVIPDFPKGSWVRVRWYGIEYWASGRDARNLGYAFKAGGAGAAAAIGYMVANGLGSVVAVAVVHSVFDSVVDECLMDDRLGVRLLWPIGGVFRAQMIC